MGSNSSSEELDKITVDEVIRKFLFYCQSEKNLNPDTLKAYATDLKQFASFLKYTKDMANFECMSKETLNKYLQKISPLKPTTIKRKVASLKAMLNFFEWADDEYVNPFHKLKICLKEPNLAPSVMTLGEVTKLLTIMHKELANNPGTNSYSYQAQTCNLAMAEILFATGMRVYEVCNLNSGDVNIEKGTIRVLQKNNKERIIHLCQSETLSIITNYYKSYRQGIESNAPFLINRLGQRTSPQLVRLMIKSYAEKARLPKRVTPHTFRNTFINLLLEQGVDIKYIRDMLGYGSYIATNENTPVNPNEKKEILFTKHPRFKLRLTRND